MKAYNWVFFLSVSIATAQTITQQGVTANSVKLGEFAFGNNPNAIDFYTMIRNKVGYDVRDKKVSIKDIEGSMYITDYFLPGTVYYNGEDQGIHYLRYDAYNDEVEVKKEQFEEGPIQALLKTAVISCNIDNESLFYMPHIRPDNNRAEGYLFELHKGKKYEVYMRKSKLFKEAKKAQTSLQGSFPPRLIDQVEYYYKKTGDAAIPIYLGAKKKELLAHFPDDKKTLETYIKEQHLDIATSKDVLQLFLYMETLP